MNANDVTVPREAIDLDSLERVSGGADQPGWGSWVNPQAAWTGGRAGVAAGQSWLQGRRW
jgi:hypothetical protein